MTDIIRGQAEHESAGGPTEDTARQQAIKQIERRRHFWVHTVLGTIALIVVVIIWALNEYHNAGGWPTDEFSESSGIHHVWNSWIIYPLVVWVMITAGRAWLVFGQKPISEADIRREMDRQTGIVGGPKASTT